MSDETRKDASPTATREAAEAGSQSPADTYERPKGARPHDLAPLKENAPQGEVGNMDLLMDVSVPVVAQLGATEMRIRDILRLAPGSIVELDKLAGEPVDLFVRGQLFAQGEVVVVDENFGVRVTRVVSPDDRNENQSPT